MPLAMTLGATTATAQTLNFAGYTAGSSIQIQYSSRPDFAWAVSPSATIAADVSATLQRINHNSLYYVRAREILLAGGAVQAWVPTQAFRTGQTAARDLAVPAIMIEPAIVVVPQPVLEWDASNAIAGFPVANLGFDAPVAFRSSHATVHTFYARTGPEPIDTIALLMSNISEAATVTISAGAAKGSATYTTGALAFRASPNLPQRPGFHGLFRLPAAQSHQWWTIQVNDQLFAGILHLEHAIFGLNRATKNHSVDKVESPADYGALERNRAGIPNRISGMRGRRVDFEISMLTELQFENSYADLRHKVGTTDPMLIVPNSKAGAYLHDRILYGALVGQKSVNPASPRYTQTFTVDSIV